MSSKPSSDEPRPQGADRPRDPARRDFLGSAAALTVAAVGLAACDTSAATAPEEGGRTAPGGASFDHKSGSDPWWSLHHKIKSVIGSATDVKVPTLEQVPGGYLQRIVTDTDRTGTGLATIVRNYYKFADGNTLTVQVQTSTGKKYAARTLYSQSDLAYAAKDALATNTIFDGVTQESTKSGYPVVALLKPSVVQFWNSVSSDYYGNHLQVASQTLVDIIYSTVGNYKLTSTTRDLTRS